MKVVHFQRRRGAFGNFSIERLFTDVRDGLPATVECIVGTCPYQRGVLGRIVNIVTAAFTQGDVNHIVGDVNYLALLLKKKRTVLTVHDCVGLRDPRWFHRQIRRYLWYVIPAGRVELVTVVSDATREELVRRTGLDPSRVRVVPNCVSPEFVSTPRQFDESRYRILHIGTNENKNLTRLVDAVKGLSCELRIIGRLTAAQRHHLNESGISYSDASNLTSAEIVGEYRRCDIVAFVSTYEGFGMPILEGQATGRPVVTSKLPPMLDVAGGGACLVDPCDVASIRAGIDKVASDALYRKRLVGNGFVNVGRYSREAIGGMYGELYQEIWRGAGRRENADGTGPHLASAR